MGLGELQAAVQRAITKLEVRGSRFLKGVFILDIGSDSESNLNTFWVTL